MLRRSLQICLAAALLAHGLLIWALAHVGVSGAGRSESQAARVMELVRVSAASGARSAAAIVPAPAGVETPVSVAPARTASAQAATRRTELSPSLRTVGQIEDFLPQSALERAPLPRSAPDIGTLNGLLWSGVPMQLRLFIDAKGTVVDVVVLQSADSDEVLQRVRQMFLATGFVPGRLNGVDVASYKDLELVVGDLR